MLKVTIVLSFILFFLNVYSQDETNDSLEFSSIDLEYEDLYSFPNIAKRITESKLILTIDDGTEIILKNEYDMNQDGTDYVYYQLAKYYPSINSYLIAIIEYEYLSFRLVNKENGKTQNIMSEIFLSPDNKNFITFNDPREDEWTTYSDLSLTKLAPVLQVFKVNSKENVIEFELFDITPINVKWIDNKSFIITLIDYETNEKYIKTIRLVNNKWVE
jgi:hypothetical protein